VKSRLLIHVPHASIAIPLKFRDQFLLDDGELRAEALTSADLWTDLLAVAAWPQAIKLIASVSRIVIDVERYSIDLKEEMSSVGRGMIYTRTHDGRPLRSVLPTVKREALQGEFYDPHWRQLRAVAAGCILVDLHTYPRDPWPAELHASGRRPEIDIGTSDRVTPDGWRETLVRHFSTAGYDTAENTPYRGVIDAGADAAVMIEIRRDVLGRGPGTAKWTRLVSSLAAMPLPIANVNPSAPPASRGNE